MRRPDNSRHSWSSLGMNESLLAEHLDIEKRGIEPSIFANEQFYYYTLPGFDEGGVCYKTFGSEIGSNKFIVPNGSLLISKLNPRIRRVWQIENDSFLRSVSSTEFVVVIAKENTDTGYLYYVLQSEEVYGKLVAEAIGTTNSHTRFKPNHLLSIEVSFPAIEYQKKIAKVLRIVDQAIEKTEALIEKYQQIKAGLMHDLFTRGIGPDGRLRPPREQTPELYQETSIGWIPKEWVVDDFGVNVEIIDPNPSHRYPLEVDEGFPICSTENFHEEDGFSFEKSKRVSMTVYNEQNNRCRFKAFDVVFARKGKIGMARRYGDDEKVFSHTVVLMKPSNDMVDRLWLLWLARSDWFLGGIEITMNTNSGVPTLGVDFIRSISVPFPQPDEQRRIAETLDCSSSKIANEIERKEKFIRQKSGLMCDLLTGKVQVTPDASEVTHV